MEEILENTNTNETIDVDYISVINDLKANSVSRDQYQKLKSENQRLLNTLITGGQIETPKDPVDKDKLRKELYNDPSALSNVEYWTKTMQLREAIIDEGGKDPFLPAGSKVIATEEDIAAAERVASAINHCLDVADGDNLIFTNELQRITVDTPVVRRRRK